VLLDDAGDDWIEFERREYAEGLSRAVDVRKGLHLTKKEMLGLHVPVGEASCALWDSAVIQNSLLELTSLRDGVLQELDLLVGSALGLTFDEIGFVSEEMRSDPFLCRMQPRYPGSRTRLQGFRTDLDASDRYRK
jgi:hypothetical protein